MVEIASIHNVLAIIINISIRLLSHGYYTIIHRYSVNTTLTYYHQFYSLTSNINNTLILYFIIVIITLTIILINLLLLYLMAYSYWPR